MTTHETLEQLQDWLVSTKPCYGWFDDAKALDEALAALDAQARLTAEVGEAKKREAMCASELSYQQSQNWFSEVRRLEKALEQAEQRAEAAEAALKDAINIGQQAEAELTTLRTQHAALVEWLEQWPNSPISVNDMLAHLRDGVQEPVK